MTDTDICLKCVDVNEVIYDEKEKYLKKVSSASLDCKEELFREILTNLEVCQEVCFSFIKQLVIIKEPRVRFKLANDVTGLQTKIEKKNLSVNLKTCLREICKEAYSMVKEKGLFNNLVEFDGERYATVDMFGKTQEKMAAFMDMMTLIDSSDTDKKLTDKQACIKMLEKDTDKKIKLYTTKHQVSDIQSMTDAQVEETSINKGKGKKQNKLEKQKRVHESKDILKTGHSQSEEDIVTQQISDRAIVTFVLTPRISVNAVQVFKQLLYLHMLGGSQLYLLVCHVGPLNEEQELVLYQYIPDQALLDVCQAPGCLDLAKLENVFRDVHGQRLQKLADLKEYFKYYIYDCPGVKDHAKDNKDRLERYLMKREQKKENKRKRKEEKKAESEFGSELAEACSQQSFTKSLDTCSDTDITSAADLANYNFLTMNHVGTPDKK